MKTILSSAAAMFATACACFGEPPPDALIKSLTKAIHEHCPDAAISTEDAFKAKSGTMMFTVHGRSMTGEISPKTHQEEGPNYKGFMLSIALNAGPYEGQAMVPQELHGPYFPTYINAVPTEDGKNHYWIAFSYGSRLDPKLKQAIFDALPGAKPRTPATRQDSLPK